LGERLLCKQEVAGSIPAGSMRPVTTIRKLAFIALPALLLAACGSKEIDSGKAEKLIQQNITPQPKAVDCPDGVEAKGGETFTCKLTYEHGVPPAQVTVHIENDDGRIRVAPGDVRFQR
jgi:hypothetical protein